MNLPTDPLQALGWAFKHSGDAWWVFGAIAAGIAWTSKRMRDWNRRNTPAGIAAAAKARAKAEAAAARWMSRTQPQPAPPAAAAPAQPAAPAQAAGPAAYAAAPSYSAAAYAAQAAYAAPVAGASHGGSGRKLHREGGGQRSATPVARSMDVPVAAVGGAWTLEGAFGDPAHARTAIVIAEVLGPPVGLR